MARIGIDFGTTNSLIVGYDKKENKFFEFNKKRGKAAPISSTVWYYDQNIVVGSEARENINKYAGIEGHHFEKSIKLKLGQENSFSILGREVKPTKVTTDILNHLLKIAKWEADAVNISFNSAIFTIPINFNGIQRKALRQAAQNAGVEVTTFIHEPFAAIIGYYFSKGIANNTQEIITELKKLNDKFLLTFDWGGGTLDITVIKVENGKMIEIGTSELTGKAGDKFDEDIAKWAWEKFLNKYISEYNEAFLEQKRKDCWDKILAQAEECKIALSELDNTVFTVSNIVDNLHIVEHITRADLEALIENTLLQAGNEIDKAIKEAQIGDINIDYVLLVGGTSHIPAIQKKLKEKFGHKVIAPKNSELLIAQGAAVISEMGWLPFLTKDVSIQLHDDSLYPIFEKNTPIAADNNAKKSEDLVCCDHRGGEAKIIIVEGNGQRKDRNLAILKVPVENNSTLNDDIKLNAIIDTNIILEISACSLMAGRYRKTEVHQLCFGLDFEKTE